MAILARSRSRCSSWPSMTVDHACAGRVVQSSAWLGRLSAGSGGHSGAARLALVMRSKIAHCLVPVHAWAISLDGIPTRRLSRGAGRQVSAAAVMLMSASSSLSMVSAESAESRPSRFAVASRAWTRRPRPEGWQLQGGRGRGRLRGQVCPGQLKITVQLACN
jgi:hypothetical protein